MHSLYEYVLFEQLVVWIIHISRMNLVYCMLVAKIMQAQIKRSSELLLNHESIASLDVGTPLFLVCLCPPVIDLSPSFIGRAFQGEWEKGGGKGGLL